MTSDTEILKDLKRDLLLDRMRKVQKIYLVNAIAQLEKDQDCALDIVSEMLSPNPLTVSYDFVERVVANSKVVYRNPIRLIRLSVLRSLLYTQDLLVVTCPDFKHPLFPKVPAPLSVWRALRQSLLDAADAMEVRGTTASSDVSSALQQFAASNMEWVKDVREATCALDWFLTKKDEMALLFSDGNFPLYALDCPDVVDALQYMVTYHIPSDSLYYQARY